MNEFKKGFLVTDKYAGYAEICRENSILRCYCWVHARRKFVEMIDPNAPPDEMQLVNLIIRAIDEMLAADKKIRNADYPEGKRAESILKKREEIIKPLIEGVFDKLERIKTTLPLLPKSRFGKAINYILNSREEFSNFLKNEKLEPSNNLSEQNVRFFTLLRKNVMFAGSERGGKATAMICSIISSAKANGLNIMKYLRYIITEFPSAKQSEIANFLPHNCPQFKL